MSDTIVFCEIKERRGGHLVKTDVYKGDPTKCVAFLVEKYGASVPSLLKRVFESAGKYTEHGKQK